MRKKTRVGGTTVSLKRLSATNEWKIVYIEDGRAVESKAYYTDDKEDALYTFDYEVELLKKAETERVSS